MPHIRAVSYTHLDVYKRQEFKSAVQENTTIMDAYKQLTIRYRRDIPEIFKYNAFVVISDGANNKYGSFFKMCIRDRNTEGLDEQQAREAINADYPQGQLLYRPHWLLPAF